MASTGTYGEAGRPRGIGEAGDELPRLALEQTDDLVIAVDDALRMVYANHRALPACGAEPLGRDVAEAGPFGDAGAEVREFLERAMAAGEDARTEVRIGVAGGDPRVLELHVAAHRDAGGRARALLLRAVDVTEARRAADELRAREREFRTLAENSPDNILRYGLDGRVVYCNRDFADRVGVSPGEVVGRTTGELAGDRTGFDAYQALLERALIGGEHGTVEQQVRHPGTGEVRVHMIAIAPERDERGRVCGAVAVGRDVTEQVRVRQALAEKEREFRTLAENAGDNIVRWDAQIRVRYLNPAMARVFGVPAEEVLGRHPHETFPDRRFAQVVEAAETAVATGEPQLLDLRFPGPDGMQFHQIRMVPERDDTGAVVSVLGVGRDITEKMTQMELIESLLHRDPLTQLFNRQALHERAPTMLAGALRRGSQVAVMLLDLDHFKAVNDGLGHSAGDLLLRQVADRVSDRLRPDDMLVRLGGDEFVVIAPSVGDPREVAAIVGRLQSAVGDPVDIDGRQITVSASIGVAIFPDDGAGLEELLAHADSAMYHAKHSGRGRSEYYRSELSEAVHRRLMLQETMREACSGAGLELYFQPQVRLDAPGRLIGAEALLRWHHPVLGMLTPDAFIELAEETGMIAPIGRWVLRAAAQTAARWNRDRIDPLCISVNVSTRQFTLDGLAEAVHEALAHTGCDPRWLGLEITESALLEDSPVVQRTLEDLRALGIPVALDDFGTGYSALNYLARFPVDHMKIDRSFVQGIGHSERGDELVKAFIAMASALQLGTVAEGIETAGQAAFLLAHGCPVAQGYLYGRPVSAAQFEALHLRGQGVTGVARELRRAA